MQRSKAGTQGRGVKMKPGQPTAKNLPDKAPTQKPFAGRVFYLDIASRLVAEKLEKDIKELGGTVEGFLSKEISFLITNKKEAKCTKSLRYQCSLPSPEPASGSSSARPSAYRGDVQDGGSSKKPEKEDVSRGKSLLKKVIKEQEILPRNSILANALNWGVRVLHLDEAKIYIDQKKRSLQHGKQPEQADAPTKPVAKRPPRRKVKAQKLKSPFIKVEDSSCQYKPLYLVLPLFRSFQSPVSKHCRPADKKPAAAQKATETKQNLNKTWHGQEEGNLSHNKLKEQKKRGYCECCLQKYDDLEAHLLSPQHKNYAQGSYYQDVDNLITLFEFDFVDWSKFRHETQGSGLFIPGAVKQEEKEFPPRIDHVSTNPFPVHNPESGVVQVTESAKPPAAACSLVHNLVCYSEPMFTTPCPPQSMCSVTCVTDSFSKPLSSQVITPTHENVSSAQIAEPPNISPDHNEGAPKDLSPKHGDFKALIEVERSETADNDQHCVAQPANCCPNKRLKLDDSLVEGNGVSAAPPLVQTGPSKDLEKSGPLGQSDACCHLPQSSSPSKLHRKVKQLERKKSEELPCKVSVPLEDCDISVSKERLEWLFQSSDLQTEFLGFSCCSAEDLKCTEDVKEQALHRHDLWSLISNTDSSASTFNGF